MFTVDDAILHNCKSLKKQNGKGKEKVTQDTKCFLGNIRSLDHLMLDQNKKI